MLHSASSTSIESLSSYGCDYSYGSSGQGLPYNLSSNSLPSTMSNFDAPINAASSMPNLEHMPECDPDYNVTLTPDMYCDMRQAMSMTQAMDSMMGMEPIRQSNPDSVPNSPTNDSRPSFYIESSRHTFTVTTNVDNRYPLYQGVPCQNNCISTVAPSAEQAAAAAAVQQQQQQQQLPQLCKSNSLPSQYYDCDQYTSQQQSMDYEDSYY
ncbi:unnamed protein product [Heligmosomoides polygyrus]|uniref:Sox C-terminal domain-containing protein n=1 Tax=Heligmosomoides polygyrus TaxID=6339 RepID=A0A183FYP3_HELPZ|nr:unnamed protein product [Heligmosomoides polygyrus]